ncbi:uncharacterized protein UBRO_13427 [Ustilago bromivora]|uniref:Uncharacterized protein n=1 Tax=Ustilago bromivora TaxID=307758 RepID=A0A1K0GA05_9BASI|nr:uncharacterized protein UBRO_13427 [Ustilago bromivora]
MHTISFPFVLLSLALLLSASSTSQAASLGRRGNVGQNRLDLTLRLGPSPGRSQPAQPSTPFHDAEQSNAESSSFVPTLSQYPPSPVIHPIDQVYLNPQPHPPEAERLLFGYPINSERSWVADQPWQMNTFEQAFKMPPGLVQIEKGKQIGEGSSSHPQAEPEQVQWDAQASFADQQEPQKKFRQLRPKPPTRPTLHLYPPEWTTPPADEGKSSRQPRSHSQMRMFGKEGKVTAEAGYKVGDDVRTGAYLQMYGGHGPFLDDSGVAQLTSDSSSKKVELRYQGSEQARRWEQSLNSDIKRVKSPPTSGEETAFDLTQFKTLFEKYKVEHLGQPLSAVIRKVKFFAQPARDLQERIDALVQVKEALLKHPSEPLTEAERRMFEYGRFQDWHKIAGNLLRGHQFQERVPIVVQQALEEDLALVRRFESVMQRLAGHFWLF